MKKVIILLLDSFGVGAAHDAAQFGDQGADTFGHIVTACATGQADKAGVRTGPLQIPHLRARGLGTLAMASTGIPLPGLPVEAAPSAKFGYAVETSRGKDTPSGHWEIAGVPVDFDWGYFPATSSFPETLLADLIESAELPGILGNCAMSGTTILEQLGDEHIATGKPIVYTSGDSVVQIAADEASFGLERLYRVCEVARKLVDPYQVGRVIARPFVREDGQFVRTGHRRDYTMPPPDLTLLDHLKQAGMDVISIGKTADIFAHRGITQSVQAHGNQALFDATLDAVKQCQRTSLIFTNFVDFDSLYGHRRDVVGYAAALEALDARLPELDALLGEEDVVVITADHGCDPTLPGSDHTREHIPVILYGPSVEPGFIGRRETFADIGQTLAEYFAISPLPHGVSFW